MQKPSIRFLNVCKQLWVLVNNHKTWFCSKNKIQLNITCTCPFFNIIMTMYVSLEGSYKYFHFPTTIWIMGLDKANYYFQTTKGNWACQQQLLSRSEIITCMYRRKIVTKTKQDQSSVILVSSLLPRNTNYNFETTKGNWACQQLLSRSEIITCMYRRKIVTKTKLDQSSVILVSSLLSRNVASCLMGLEIRSYLVVDAWGQRSCVFPSHRAKQPPSQPSIGHGSEKPEDCKIFTRFSKHRITTAV